MNHKIIHTFSILALITALLISTLPVSAVAPIRGQSDETILTTLDQPFTLGIGQAAMISDSTDQVQITLAGLVSDSRCPANVDCAQAGEAIFTLELSIDGVVVLGDAEIGQVRVQDRNKVRYEQTEIELTDVQPNAPAVGKELKAEEYQVTLVVHEEGKTQQATPTPTVALSVGNGKELGESFELRVDETVVIVGTEFSITLRSLSDDSGCFSKGDCSTMTADGSLALRNGEERELASFRVSFDPDTPFVYEFSGFELVMTHVEKDDNGEPVATFVVNPHVVEPPFPIPDPAMVDNCPTFSRFDAAAILQEDVSPIAVANLIFAPLPEDSPTLQGLCGYVSQSSSANPAMEPMLPHLLTQLDAAHVVVAQLLEGSEAFELFPIAETARLANPQSDSTGMFKLQTQLMAGEIESVVPFIFDNAEQSESIKTEPLQGLGDDSIWLWQAVGEDHFFAFVGRFDNKFAVVMGLVGDHVQELVALDYAVLVARRMAEPKMFVSQPPADAIPTAQPPLLPPNDLPTTDCTLLTPADAEAILGEAVYELPVFQDEGCGYVPQTEPSPEDKDFSMDATNYGIIISKLNTEDTLAQIQSLADGLGGENPQADANTLAMIKIMLSAGDVTGALSLLPAVAKGVHDLEARILGEVNERTVWIWGLDNGNRVLSVISLNADSEAIVLIASLHPTARRSQVRAAVVKLLKRIVE